MKKIIYLFLSLFIAGNVNAQVSYQCDGNNILDGVSFTVGENHFAPGWAASTDYTATYADDTFSLALTPATTDPFMAQFRLICDKQLLTKDKTYFISFDIETNVALPRVFAKAQYLGADDYRIELAPLSVEVGKTTISGISVSSADSFNVILFDFGGNPANANIKISNITICDEYAEEGEEVYFTEGIANKLSFKLDSRSLTELVVESTSLDDTTFGAVYAKVSIDGAWVPNPDAWDGKKEWNSVTTIDQTKGQRTCIIRIPASEVPGWEEGKVLTLDLGYIFVTLSSQNLLDQYIGNLVVTEGDYANSPILHKVGEGIDINIPTAADRTTVAAEQFKVSCTNGTLTVSGNTIPANATLYNITGQKVLEIKNANSANVSNLRKGAYILKIQTNSGYVEVHKIIIT